VAISSSDLDLFPARRFWYTPGERGLYQVKLSEVAQLEWLRKNPSPAIPRAEFARGISFFPGIREKPDPSLRSG
jgi:hypothetical protein